MQTTVRLAKGNCSFIFLSVAVICSASLCVIGGVRTIRAQSAVEEQIVVTGEEVPSAYGAPPGFSRSRFSSLTNAYVWPPGAIYAGIIYEGDTFRPGPPDLFFSIIGEPPIPTLFPFTTLPRWPGLMCDFQTEAPGLRPPPRLATS